MAIGSYYRPCVKRRKLLTKNTGGTPSANGYTDTNIRGYLGSSSKSYDYIGGKYITTASYKFYSGHSDFEFDDLIYYDSMWLRVISEPKAAGNKKHHYKLYVVVDKTINGVPG